MTTTTTKPHVHHDIIVEWAKNPSRQIQYKLILNDEWIDLYPHVSPNWTSTIQYRFKPEVITVTYRKALMKNWSGGGHTITNVHGSNMSAFPNLVGTRFVKWLGDPITEIIEL